MFGVAYLKLSKT